MRLINLVAMSLALALGLAGCQAVVQDPSSQGSSNPASINGCRFDSDCGRLEECFGTTCSRKFGACDFDSDCSYGEECTGRSCSRKINGCTFDSDCMSGNCEFGTCSPFRKPGACTFDSDCTSGSCLGGSCM